ncbi:MAG TPA: glycoside hydrolase family 3 N-terminal domain-containing protein [Solirubrobacteraceae bacterium]|nr:glycoside hydrolase family 3 N-terminal domain-containing protein [Solirubrobacteraceae bacterium]
MRRAIALAVAALALAACGGGGDDGARRQGTAASADAPAASGRSAGTELTPEQLAGQHVVFPFAGRTPPRALLARIRRGEAAGVIFLGANLGTPAQVRALTRRLRAVPRPPGLGAPLLLMVDQEGGSVQRLPGAPSRSAPAMAATGDPAVARAEARATAATLRAAGMNVDLAPVVDVVRPESALHAEGRGFGFGARSAARFGAAFVRGLTEGGVAATAKHFPGFGAAVENTDTSAVRIPVPLRELRTVDRRPFRAAIRAGARLVMLSSAVYPALSAQPAVFSQRVVQAELRDGLGFEGVTISDDLEAPAFAVHGGTSGAALRAAAAGIDLLLFARTYAGAARAAGALARAIRSGAVDRAPLDASLQRVLALRSSLR